MSQPIQPPPQPLGPPPARRIWLWLVIAGVAMLLAAVLLWNFGGGIIDAFLGTFAALAFFVILVLFGGLSVLSGVAVLAIRRR